AHAELQVAVTATKEGPLNGFLLFSTNDPSRPAFSIPVTATGVPGPGPQVVKVELTYENGSDSAFDEDFRNVDMTLEHPYGFVCNKQTPAPTNWGNFGNPSWLSFGPKEEPERIILVNGQQDGTYRIMLQYMQDCASLPTQLLSGILGVAVDVAQLAAAGAVLVPGKDVGALIEQICLSKKSTPATVKVYVNGVLAKEATVTLGKRGDVVYAADLVRANGTFTVP
ncbi:MAG: hypothetical protein KGN78_15135, partial [Actinomycetales bacterium]|nr:hypothetical protein [Actinomycetales bacterium]